MTETTNPIYEGGPGTYPTSESLNTKIGYQSYENGDTMDQVQDFIHDYSVFDKEKDYTVGLVTWLAKEGDYIPSLIKKNTIHKLLYEFRDLSIGINSDQWEDVQARLDAINREICMLE